MNTNFDPVDEGAYSQPKHLNNRNQLFAWKFTIFVRKQK